MTQAAQCVERDESLQDPWAPQLHRGDRELPARLLFRSRSCIALCRFSHVSSLFSFPGWRDHGALPILIPTPGSSKAPESCFQVIGIWKFLSDRTLKEMIKFESETL